MKSETIFKYMFILILPSVLVSFAANSFFFIIASLIAIVKLRNNYPPSFFKKYLWFSTFIVSILLALTLDVYNQQVFDIGELTKRLAFILMPIVVYYSKNNHQRLALKILVYFLTLMSSALMIIGLMRSWLNKGNIVYGNWDSDTTEKFYANEMLLNWGELSYKRIFLFLDMHPSYYAFFSTVVISILLFTSIIKQKKWQRLTLLILHSAMILMVSSKAGIISLLLITIIEFFHRKQPKQMIIGIFIFSLIILSALSMPSTRLRIERAYESITQQDNPGQSNSLGRLILWNSLNEFSSQELATGIGINASREKIKKLTGVDKNMHNQFLQSLVSGGIIGFFLLFCFILLPVIYSKHLFTYVFIALLFINLLLENMMDRVWGIMIISFFYSLFIFGDQSLFKKNSDQGYT